MKIHCIIISPGGLECGLECGLVCSSSYAPRIMLSDITFIGAQYYWTVFTDQMPEYIPCTVTYVNRNQPVLSYTGAVYPSTHVLTALSGSKI